MNEKPSIALAERPRSLMRRTGREVFCRTACVRRRALGVLAVMAAVLAVGRAEAQVVLKPCATTFDAIPGGGLTGVINTYYQPTASVAAGATAISVNTTTRGSGTALVAGDMALVIQMQDADINSNNTSAYGSGGTSGSGFTSTNNVGRYEYIVVTAVAGNGKTQTLTVRGAGAGGNNSGLIYAYTLAAATASQGARTYQVIRVPRYNGNATLAATPPTASPWDGATGGVLAFDVSGTLNLNGRTVSVDGLGFRGGAGYVLIGTTTGSRADYVTVSNVTAKNTPGANGSKGEGIAGTPRLVYTASTGRVDNGTEGYPVGSYARGAPGTAGGGATDANPVSNNQNAGGGGGGNCGAGGVGGYNYAPTPGPTTVFDVGGRGGAAYPAVTNRVVMGGGGGAGSTNSGTPDGTGLSSSGVPGGGILLVRVGATSGTGIFSANGADATLIPTTDGSGGGGAGGSIIVTGGTGATFSGLTLRANGGKGGSNTGNGVFAHGPGGGGGAGYIFSTGAVASASATGGANGTTAVATGYTASYGATAGGTGACVNTAIDLHDEPGAASAWQCVVNATEVRLRRFDATVQPGGVLVRWQTGAESNNLGFNVLRERSGQRTSVTPELVAGAALKERTTLRAGYSYAWRDPDGQPGDRYWLEDVDLSGARTLHGPAPVQGNALLARLQGGPVRFELSATPRTALLSDVGAVREPARSRPMPQDEALGLFGHAQLLTQRQLAAGAGVKLAIREQGWYRVTAAELAAIGFDTARVDPRRLSLYVAGRERPILVRGERDGRFDPGDAIEFYGAGIDLPTTGDNVYWLAVGPRPGLRMASPLPSPRVASPEVFLSTVERRDRTIYFPALRNDGGEKFFGGIVGSRVSSQKLTLVNLATAEGAVATVEVALQGATLAPHQVDVQLNGAPVGTLTYDGQAHAVQTFEVPQSLLVEGENVVTLARQAGVTDASLVDAVRISYWRRSVADGGELRLTVPGGVAARVDGFSRPDIRAVDITDPFSPLELTGPVTASGGSYGMSVRPLRLGARTLLTFTGDRVKRPAALWLNTPSDWAQATHGADLVIVAHRSLLGEVGPLAALRQQQGYRVAVVDVEDVYDEFSFGLAVPQALKDFFAQAKTAWRIPPRFALLVGDASVDARNYLGGGAYNLVPTQLFDTDTYEAASDDSLVDLDGDDLPELAIGRLPARTAEEARLMVSKLLAYDAQPAEPRPALLVADDGQEEDFLGSTEEVRGLLPFGLDAQEVLRGPVDDATARQQVLDGVNGGPLLVNFSGHGSIDLWRAGLLTNDDAPALHNGSRLPVFVLMTCMNGAFHTPDLDSLGESLLKAPNGGAVAVWASSTVTQPYDQHAMNAELYRQLFGATPLTLGEAAARAKAAALGDVRRSWILLGDPTLKLH